MADSERMVGGLRCREVLERLSDYLDGDLAPAEVTRVQEHVRGCDWCERQPSEQRVAHGRCFRLRRRFTRNRQRRR